MSELPACSSSPGPESEDDEIDKLMRSSPPPEDDEMLEQPLPGGATTGEPGAPTSASQPDEDGNGLLLSGVSRNEQAILRRTAEKLKVHPYQRNLLRDFVKVCYHLTFEFLSPCNSYSCSVVQQHARPRL